MRVLLAVHGLPPRSTAGTEVYTLRLAQALRELGHDVLVLAAVHDLGARTGELRERAEQGIAVDEVVSNHDGGTFEATYDDPRLAAAAAQAIARFRPDCVHVQHLIGLSTAVVAAARAAGARVVMTLHDHWLSCPRDGLRMRADGAVCTQVDHSVCAACLCDSPYVVPPLQRRLVRLARAAGAGTALQRLHGALPRWSGAALRAARRASPAPRPDAAALDRRAAHLREVMAGVDAVIAPTRFAGATAAASGTVGAPIRVLGYGAITASARARTAGPRRRMGFIGTVARHKGVHVLLASFRGVADPAARLEIHGSLRVDPVYAAEVGRLAAEDSRITIHGAFSDGEQGRILRGLDVLVIPSVWWENSPLVVLEALAAGVPVIASEIGGLPEIVPAGAGLLVPPGDVGALRAALLAVAAGQLLGGALPALAVKTAMEGARELARVYAGQPA